jgi:hypothetical protein
MCRVAGVLLVFLLSACSGGGDEQPSRHTDVSAHSVSFSAGAPDAATPAVQTLTATFGADVANVAVIHTGAAIADVTSALTGRTAQITITPSAPSKVGAGIATGTVAVTGYFCADAGCSRVEAGNSETIAVTYQVSPVVSYVAPYVGVAGASATAVIRGVGFQGFAVRGVTFGTTAATAVAVVSDTEIRATYPTLTAGSYPVGLDVPTHQGAVPSTATLTVVDPIAYAAQTLSYPAAVTTVRSLIYDAQRSSLLLATDANGGTILRYPYAAGAWGAAASTAVADLRDVALSTDGAQLVAAATTSVTPADPATLALGTAVAAPALPTGNFLKNIAIANNNTAVVTTTITPAAATLLYSYTVNTATLLQSATALNNATPGMSANGATIVLIQGDPSLTTAPLVYTYSASSNTITASSISLNQNSIAPVLDRDATRITLNGLNVYGADSTLFGTLPTTTVAVVLKPDGTRAYTYDSTAAAVLTFDTSATLSGAAFVQVGAAVALAGDPGAGIKMTISPDGGTLFIAGSNQIVIQPTP